MTYVHNTINTSGDSWKHLRARPFKQVKRLQLQTSVCRQPIHQLQDLWVKVFTLQGDELHQVLSKPFPHYSYYQCCTSDIAAADATFNIFSYDAVLAENWTHHPAEALCVTRFNFFLFKVGGNRDVD